MPELDRQRKAIGYTRCSTHEQVVSGLGLTAQAERIAAYCRLQNLTCTEIIADPGVSGGKPLATRPGGQELLNAIRARGIETIVTLKLDRMFRNAGDCLTTVEQWERRGVALHVIDLGGNAIDTTSAAGRFMLTVLAGAAEMERNLTRERTRSALAVKRANGQRIGTVPFGYDLAPDGRSLAPNAAEQTAVTLIHSLRARRWTLEAIAEELTERRIPTKTGRSQRWTHQAVGRILDRLPGACSTS
ncbi:MAG: recombinase family protein [Phycisphaerales bacterium]|nr:recombinase family protein [Phycisphaerales bacterium]